jgi:hypothetical protein
MSQEFHSPRRRAAGRGESFTHTRGERLRRMTREEMRLHVGMCVSERVQTGDTVYVSFPFLREILGDWHDRADELQAKIDAFAHEFRLCGAWDWEAGTHVIFRRAGA